MTERTRSWFWYGRWEGAAGGFVPPAGLLARLLYRVGNAVGRRAGPPCTCHPDDHPPRPCPKRYAYSECVKAANGEQR